MEGSTSKIFSYKDALTKGMENLDLDSSSADSTPVEEKEKSKPVTAHDPVTTSTAKINKLVLDAGPLITQTYSEIRFFAKAFYTTPAVYAEIRDERSRANLSLWGPNLVIRQPKAVHTKAVMDLAKCTGDYAVLSVTDMQLLALCRELDVEEHGGSDEHLRKVANGPGANLRLRVTSNIPTQRVNTGNFGEGTEEDTEEKEVEDDGWAVVPPKKKKNNKFKYPKESKEQEQTVSIKESQELDSGRSEAPDTKPEIIGEVDANGVETIYENDENDEDEAGWITTENLEETLIKENGETTSDPLPASADPLPAAVSTGDFAMQNVALQMGLNLVNPTNGLHITRVKSFMLRCHACFKLCPFPRNGTVKQFCPSCGKPTLMRCTVQVSDEGQIKVFLKRNFQWTHRGNKYSMINPQSHKSRRAGRNDLLALQSQVLLSEDQKEYGRAVKHDMWKKRQNEKLLNEWIGPVNGSESGSVDSVTSPFAISGYKRDAARHTGVRVGAGRYVNSVRKQTK